MMRRQAAGVLKGAIDREAALNRFSRRRRQQWQLPVRIFEDQDPSHQASMACATECTVHTELRTDSDLRVRVGV